MDPTVSQIIQQYQSRRHLYQQLESTLFVLTEPNVLELYPLVGRCQKNLKAIKKIWFQSELSFEEAETIEASIQELLAQISIVESNYEQCRDLFNTLKRLSGTGTRLIQSTPVLTELDAGFSFTGRHERVGDQDFQRQDMFWVKSLALSDFESVMTQLFEYGTWQVLQPDDSASNQSLNAIQRILLCFGIGMSQTCESSVFSELPPIWDIFHQECLDLATKSHFLQKIVNAHLQEDLTLMHNAIEILMTDPQNIGKDIIQLETFIFTKEPTKNIRNALERHRELFNMVT